MFSEHLTFGRWPSPSRAAALALSAAVLTLAGCYAPDLSLTDCTLPCLQDCPSGAECRNNFCARIESSATCAEGGGGGETSGAAGATSGSATVPTGGTAGGGGASGSGPSPFDIRASSTDTLCPGQVYQIELTASGGAAPYTWSLPEDAPTSAKLSAATGAVVQLTGIAAKPQPKLQVRALDSSGDSASTDILLTVGAVGPGECPQITPTHLPDPCLENTYSANNILVTGGTSPYVWNALSIPEGLQFNATTQTLAGTALPAGMATPLTLQVTDNQGHQTQLTYPLGYRDRCWLGFTATVSGGSKMDLYDPALDQHALQGSSNNVGVVDFKFSPDGKFLVYRRSSGSPAERSLVLAAAPSWQEQVLDFGGSVLAYSWSGSAQVLAVAFQTAADTELGGVNVAGAVVSPSSGSGITGLQVLQPIAMLDPASAPLDSELLWFQGDTYLAFHADAIPGLDSGFEFPYYAHYGQSGFSDVNVLGDYLFDPTVQLLPAHNGIFAVSPEGGTPQLDFYGSAGGTDTDLYLRSVYTSAATDPAGLYVAVPEHDKLQIYLTAESGGTEDPPTPWLPSTDECSSILAWDASRERIACDTHGPPLDGEIRLFDLVGTDSVPQLTSSALKGLSGYQQGSSASRRRTFSPKGNWLAFATDAGLDIGDVRGQPQLHQLVPLPAGSTSSGSSELAFSPDEAFVLWQVDGNFGVVQLQKNGATSWYGVDVPFLAPATCNEEFTAGPREWCGRQQKLGAAWSPDSRYVGAVTAAHGLRLFDLRDYSLGSVSIIDACQSGCQGDFTFQPAAFQSAPP